MQNYLKISFTKFKMEMVNISKRQQPDQRADNSHKATNYKNPVPEMILNWPLNKICTCSVKIDNTLNSKTDK